MLLSLTKPCKYSSEDPPMLYIKTKIKENVINADQNTDWIIPFGEFTSGSSVSSPNYPAESYPVKQKTLIIKPIEIT